MTHNQNQSIISNGRIITMSSIRKLFATNQDIETKGIWMDYGSGVEIQIARAGGSNKAFATRFTALSKPFRRQIQAEMVDESTAQEILYRVYAECVVRGWRGITQDDIDPKATNPTEPLPYSVENCVALFKALPDLANDVVAQAGKLAMFRQVSNEADAGN
jgi:hypothetical protein